MKDIHKGCASSTAGNGIEKGTAFNERSEVNMRHVIMTNEKHRRCTALDE